MILTGRSTNLSQIELTVAISVSSMPGFAGFIRTNVSNSKLASSLLSLFGSITRGSSRDTTQKSAGFDPNQPRSGQNFRKNEQRDRYYELNETWLLDSRVKVDIEHQVDPLQPAHSGRGVRVQNSVDVEQSSWAPSEGFTTTRG